MMARLAVVMRWSVLLVWARMMPFTGFMRAILKVQIGRDVEVRLYREVRMMCEDLVILLDGWLVKIITWDYNEGSADCWSITLPARLD